uniref:Putative LOV domain-containing protein n=1 Tax=Bryopsis plumosa TaxID=3130 RepID=A0A126WYP7_BRYPL|nr:putative LOV domain-containing protein [Bryopsis plumosa]
MAFICLCPEKSLELGVDENLQRGAKEQFVEEYLHSAQLGANNAGKLVRCLPGGGVAIDSSAKLPKLAEDGPFLSALTGSIQNYAYLVKKYLQDDLALPPNVTLEAIKERIPISEAALLCKLFSRLGTGMLSKLRGHFSFCLYDSTTVRVLAARDPSGTVPLIQGQLPNNALFVTSSASVPAGAHDVVEIQPGNYKYGWRASPRKYTNPETVVKSCAQTASQAAMAALSGINRKSPAVAPDAPRRASIDVVRSSKKSSEENRRQSLDHHKGTSRADEEGWWRSKRDTLMGGEDESSPADGEKGKRSRRRRRRSPKGFAEEMGNPDTSEARNAERFINELGGAFLEDSASVRMLRSLLCCSPCSLVVTDTRCPDHPIVFVNDSFESQTGYSRGEVIGKNCRFMQAPLNTDRIPSLASKSIRKALEGGRSASVRILNYKKDGAPVWNELSVVPLRNAEGVITHHVGMQTFSNAPEARSVTGDSVTSVLGNKRGGLLRSRSCNDVLVMANSQFPSAAPNLAF